MPRGVSRGVLMSAEIDRRSVLLLVFVVASSMRFVLLALLVLALQTTDATRIRLLLRDETDAGVAAATLTLRLENGQRLDLATDANGVAVSNDLHGKAVWLIGGRRADGRALIADSYPADAGFRLVLIAGQTRDALLRLDGDRIVLDPDMIFSPGDPGEPPPPTPPQLVATVPPISAAAPPIAGAQAPIMTTGESASAATPNEAGWFSPLWLVLGLVCGGVVLVVLAFLIGLARRRAA